MGNRRDICVIIYQLDILSFIPDKRVVKIDLGNQGQMQDMYSSKKLFSK